MSLLSKVNDDYSDSSSLFFTCEPTQNHFDEVGSHTNCHRRRHQHQATQATFAFVILSGSWRSVTVLSLREY